MTALKWFNAYVDAVEVSYYFMQCTTVQQAHGFYNRMMARYRNNKGKEHADSVAAQVDAMLEGVEAMRQGEVP